MSVGVWGNHENLPKEEDAEENKRIEGAKSLPNTKKKKVP